MMPDHLHLIAEGRDDTSDCLEFVRLFKQRTAFEWKRGGGVPLWQESFYDHILRSDETTQRAVRYVLENPVRAKLVASPGDYPHAGSLIHERDALIEWAFGASG
jgi:REP element-mobilizing transposase RayT